MIQCVPHLRKTTRKTFKQPIHLVLESFKKHPPCSKTTTVYAAVRNAWNFWLLLSDETKRKSLLAADWPDQNCKLYYVPTVLGRLLQVNYKKLITLSLMTSRCLCITRLLRVHGAKLAHVAEILNDGFTPGTKKGTYCLKNATMFRQMK